MKTLKIPKITPKISRAALLTKPYSKPKGSISKPRPERQLEPKPSIFEFQLEIDALQQENLKCARQVAKLKAEITRLKNDYKVLTEDFEKYKRDNPPFDCETASEEIKRLEQEIKEYENKNT